VVVETAVWKEIVARRRSAVAALATGDLRVSGGRLAFARFMKMFDAD
jgi:putative sterol carrier protein